MLYNHQPASCLSRNRKKVLQPVLSLLCFAAFMLLGCQLIVAQQIQTRHTRKKYEIPFRLTSYNNLSVQALLNKKDTVWLMFHTASSAVTLTEDAIKKITSLQFDRTDSVKSWGGAGNTSRFSSSNTLQIGELVWEQVPVWENKNSGQGTDGKFGTDLFAGKVIEIDFERQVLVLHHHLPHKTRRYEKCRLQRDNDMLFIDAGCGTGKQVVQNRFLLHSGYAGAVLLDDRFASDNKLDQQLETIGEKQLKDSYGNVLKTKKALLPFFKIGKEQLNNVPVAFFQGAIGRQKMSVIGGDVLKRFNLVIDAPRQYIYLKPNSLQSLAYTNV
jgi:hypothetical protein